MKSAKNKIVTLGFALMVLCMTMNVGARDIPTTNQASEFLKTKGLIQGDDKGNLMLNQQLTREQMMVIISRLLGQEEAAKTYSVDELTFLDVPKESWAAPYIAWAKANKITEGYSPEKFGYGETLTDWQTKTFLVRTLGYKDILDAEMAQKAEQLGITLGVTLKEGTPILRGEMALLMYNALYASTSDGEMLGENLGFLTVNNKPFVRQGDWVYFSNTADENKLYKYTLVPGDTFQTKLCDDAATGINVVGNWIYYSNVSDGYKLYKIKTDGTGRTKLSDSSSSNINVVGDTIYFVNYSDGSKIYKVKTDGTSETKINDESSTALNIQKDWIYYVSYTNNNKVYKIKTDGTGLAAVEDRKELVSVIGDVVYFINNSISQEGPNVGTGLDYLVVNNGWIFYKNNLDEGKLYKKQLDGTQNTKVSDDSCGYIKVDGQWIYYVNYSDGSKVYKVKIDGTGRAKLADLMARDLIISSGYVYYKGVEDDKLYRVKADGSGQKEIIADHSIDLTIDGDWIYYKNNSDNSKLYKIKTDGTRKTKLTEDSVSEATLSNNWLYYKNISDGSKLYKIKTDGTGKTKLTSFAVVQNIRLDESGEWIYFSNISDDYQIYKVRVNGQELTKVNHESSVVVAVVGDWVYYKNLNVGDKLFRIKVTGISRNQIN